MRKNQRLLIAGILLLASTGVAQAQGAGVYEVFSNAVVARTGGAAELSGNVVLFLRTGNNSGGTVTLTYSAPLAKGTVPMMQEGTQSATDVTLADEDREENRVTIIMPSTGQDIVTISNVRLDLREAEVPVTITASGDAAAFVSGVSNVISGIQDALTATSESAQILTRGGMGSATVELKETFASAFTAGADVKLTLVGVPDKASLLVSHAGFDMEAGADNPAAVTGDVTLNDTEIVTSDALTGESLMMMGDGDKLNITVGFTAPTASSTESVTLMFDLAATSDQEDLTLPLDEGVVEVWVTMAPDEAEDMPDGSTEDEYFAVNYIPTDGVVAFTIAPASCTLLFPYAAVWEGVWNTGIAITNPSAFTDTPLSGDLTFTLFPSDDEMIMHSTDGMSSGEGLDEDGSLPAGNTYTVLLSQVLADAGMPGDFIGHFYVRTNFTGCRGLGYVTDFASGAQAYLPYFGDNLDEGSVPANNTKPVVQQQ